MALRKYPLALALLLTGCFLNENAQGKITFSATQSASIQSAQTKLLAVTALAEGMSTNSYTKPLVSSTNFGAKLSAARGKANAIETKLLGEDDAEGKAERISGALTGVSDGLVGMIGGIKDGDWVQGVQGALGMISSMVALAGPIGMIASSIMSMVSGFLGLFGGSETESQESMIKRVVEAAINDARHRDMKEYIEGAKHVYQSLSSSVQNFRERGQLTSSQAEELYNHAFSELQIFEELKMAEELQLSLETELYKISEEKLGEVSSYLKIEDIEGKSRIFIIRKIRQEVEKALAVLEGRKADSQDIIQYLGDVLAFVTGKPPPLEDNVDEDRDGDCTDDEESISEAKREYEAMQTEFMEMLSLQEKKLQKAKARFEVPTTDKGVDLELRAVNNTTVPYKGFVELDFQLLNGKNLLLKVPFLVTDAEIINPIIGYNVIEEIVKLAKHNEDSFDSGKTEDNELLTAIENSFQKIDVGAIHTLLNIIVEETNADLSILKSPKQNFSLPPNQFTRVICRGNGETSNPRTFVLFEPDENQQWPPGLEITEKLLAIPRGKSFRVKLDVYNSTDHPIMLKSRTVLGRIELLKSITPFDVKQKDGTWNGPSNPEEENSPSVSQIKVTSTSCAINSDSDSYLSQFDLSSLNADQQKLASKLLIEESDSFSKDDDDIGCAEGLKLPINLSDPKPVQKTYTSIPKPLYPEVKQHIEDLLNKGFIKRSTSNYSSPVRSNNSNVQSKNLYDKRVRTTVLEPGDRVLVRNLSERGGPGKLRSFWERNIHKVIKRVGEDSPVHQVISEHDPSSKIRTLHRNLLLPCDELPLEDLTQNDQKQQRKKKETAGRTDQVKPQQSDDSDSEEEIFACVRPKTSEWKLARPPTPHPVRGTVSDYAEVVNDTPSQDCMEHVESLQNSDIERDTEQDFGYDARSNGRNYDTTRPEQTRLSPASSLSADSPVLQESLASPPAASTPEEYVRPRRLRQPPAYLQYPSFGNPISYPISNNMIQARCGQPLFCHNTPFAAHQIPAWHKIR
eukprot:Seg1153.8 transcript_id=Seg1153.8/GoldUCD/mRNA.D3Y31 product="Toxin CaTX-A" protein_id=Seg1153.8/GoldUCD/D3Y31